LSLLIISKSFKYVLIFLKLITNRISFGSHVATVQEYLNWYMKNKDDRTEGSQYFAEYIISACWRKMVRRIGHWAAVGLMHSLNDMTKLLGLLIVDDVAPATRQSDVKLSMYLRAMEKNNILENILSFCENYSPPNAELQRGDSTNIKILLPHLQRLCQDGSQHLYNKETAIEFHYLLVGTLLCHARALQILSDACSGKEDDNKKKKPENSKATKPPYAKGTVKTPAKPNSSDSDIEGGMAAFCKLIGPEEGVKEEEERQEEERQEEEGEERQWEGGEEGEEKQGGKQRGELSKNWIFPKSVTNLKPSSPDKPTPKPMDPVEAAKGVLFTTRILNVIIVSEAFQRHIKALVRQSFLRLPSDDNQSTFLKYARDKNIPIQIYRGARRLANVLQTPSLRERDGSGDPDFKDVTDNREGGLEEDQDTFTTSDFEDVIAVVKGWMKLFVQHVHAKSVLESFIRHAGDLPVEIKVYGVSPSKNPPLMPTWEILVEIIRSSLKDKTIEEQNEVIDVFKSHFRNNNATNDGGLIFGKNRIFDVVYDIITQKANTRSRYFNIHCEAALASLVAACRSPACLPVEVARYADKEFIAELNVGHVPSIRCNKVQLFLRRGANLFASQPS
jgi:hypothetical protein